MHSFFGCLAKLSRKLIILGRFYKKEKIAVANQHITLHTGCLPATKASTGQ